MGHVAPTAPVRSPLLAGGLFLLAVQAASAQSPAAVETVMPDVGQAVRTLELSGSVTPRRAATLSPRMPGLVAEVAVDAGDRVNAGDVLVRLDDTLAVLAVGEARAALEESRAAAKEARRLYDEGRRLVGDDFVSETEVAGREARLAVAEAAVARSESRLATVEERFARHSVVAPFDGVISDKLTEAGEWVENGAAVVELVATDELWLDVRAPQHYWSELTPDAAVTVTLEALPGRTLAAFVHARVPVSDPSARTFLVRLLFDGVDDLSGIVTPGMSGRASFRLSDDREVVRLPRDALIRYPDGTTTVWAVEERGKEMRAREIEVTVGQTSGDSVEIVSEFDPLLPVVVRGNEGLRRDQPVRVSGR
jgi:RND family efflux transporter MFP subunit